MTDEQKAWEELVEESNQIFLGGKPGCTLTLSEAKAILAADAELKRLRLAVEWAMNALKAQAMHCEDDIGVITRLNATAVELRRRAKEG